MAGLAGLRCATQKKTKKKDKSTTRTVNVDRGRTRRCLPPHAGWLAGGEEKRERARVGASRAERRPASCCRARQNSSARAHAAGAWPWLWPSSTVYRLSVTDTRAPRGVPVPPAHRARHAREIARSRRGTQLLRGGAPRHRKEKTSRNVASTTGPHPDRTAAGPAFGGPRGPRPT